MAQQAQVAQTPLTDLAEQGAHAGLVHFDADEVQVGPRRRDLRRGLAHAKANFEHPRCLATKTSVPILVLGLVRQHESRPEILQRPDLTAAHAAGAQHKAADGAPGPRSFDGCGVRFWGWLRVGHGGFGVIW